MDLEFYMRNCVSTLLSLLSDTIPLNIPLECTIKFSLMYVEHSLDFLKLYFLHRLSKVLSVVMRDQNSKVIIFAQTKKRVDEFFSVIKRLGYPVFPIHGNKRQNERDRVLQGL